MSVKCRFGSNLVFIQDLPLEELLDIKIINIVSLEILSTRSAFTLIQLSRQVCLVLGQSINNDQWCEGHQLWSTMMNYFFEGWTSSSQCGIGEFIERFQLLWNKSKRKNRNEGHTPLSLFRWRIHRLIDCLGKRRDSNVLVKWSERKWFGTKKWFRFDKSSRRKVLSRWISSNNVRNHRESSNDSHGKQSTSTFVESRIVLRNLISIKKRHLIIGNPFAREFLRF